MCLGFEKGKRVQKDLQKKRFGKSEPETLFLVGFSAGAWGCVGPAVLRCGKVAACVC